MKKIIVPGLVAGIAMLVVGMIISKLFNLAVPTLMAEYQNPALFRTRLDPQMLLFFAWPFVLGLALALVWNKVKGVIPGRLLTRATQFGLGYWIVASIPGMLITYASFPVSPLMVTSWTVGGFFQAIAAGAVLAKING
ncbi:hypothetical protein A2291_06870 [candidate division WOR-1 bacterium RIFOXYB2_FULL_42_35]|uniref:DUF1761 domain-containing protein n=1 Tax=candidate division WOR-1 bacterium RIFOXYC2_FULL_41_25 TaxID=1802586 RepID=A0A1F4TPU1_UNCSA|nr:MAG: hypothetical protein A2291_06870 [candidate division WOR-1 bacterium RIFOXYB2_FULL_42_35]OGC24601.1 MAG: hypothetical protein A2247_06650 [candidate division WOR-1 bacterium RIFOXYA2_FULL_41_14]OGC34647.1 MAG: hypothetical protein A2462_04885 [candidate division WOR-1 bacterium RIFOXYC2_FULL_41_25]OGC41596.1 MAG: hypothetical protein A2548_01200 [candidate division WOR-1 bacterium RIFOXYD2_FULL_41_8]